MSEYTPSDEFDQFLTQSVEKDNTRTSLEVMQVKTEDIVRDALKDFGYAAIDEDEDRATDEYEKEWQRTEAYLRKTYGDDTYDPDLTEKMVNIHMQEKLGQEKALLSSLKMTLFLSLVKDKDGNDENHAKRKFFAEGFVSLGLRSWDTLYHVANLVLPGDIVDINGPLMEDYIDEAELRNTRNQLESESDRQILQEALESVGLSWSFETEESTANIIAAHDIYLAGYIQKNNEAEREQAIRESALKQEIDQEIALKLADFFVHRRD